MLGCSTCKVASRRRNKRSSCGSWSKRCLELLGMEVDLQNLPVYLHMFTPGKFAFPSFVVASCWNCGAMAPRGRRTPRSGKRPRSCAGPSASSAGPWRWRRRAPRPSWPSWPGSAAGAICDRSRGWSLGGVQTDRHDAVINVNEGSRLILLRFKWTRNNAHADKACKPRIGCQDPFPTSSSH